jgi:hypothetical protein
MSMVPSIFFLFVGIYGFNVWHMVLSYMNYELCFICVIANLSDLKPYYRFICYSMTSIYLNYTLAKNHKN